MSTQKYRPYFTLSELKEIISALNSAPTPSRLTLIRYLDSFILQIERGIRKQNYTPNPTPTLAQRLELDPATPIPTSPNISGEAAYQKWLINPSKATPHEISAALDYRYLNNLMSPDEENEYERINGV